MSPHLWPLTILVVITVHRTVTVLRQVRAYRAAPAELREPRVLHADLFRYAWWWVALGAGVLVALAG